MTTEGLEAVDGFARPRIVLSRCLELEACRYNAQTVRSTVVRLLEPHVELLPVCPEVEVGLGVPRAPIRLVASDGGPDGRGGPRLVQPSTGRDITEDMLRFGRGFADATPDVDGMVLKNRSPTCGIKDVKVYAAAENAPPAGKGAGLFAAVMLDRYPGVAIEDEGRLTNGEIRHHFLTRIFASASLRAALAGGASGLVAFHTRYKLVLMAHSPSLQRELGRVVAEAGSRFEEVAAEYREGLGRALAEPAGRGAHINAIQHAQGYFKDALGAAEKRQFLRLQEEYRAGTLPIQALLAVLGSWVERFDEPYLRGQAYFRPYPRPLVIAADSGRGRLA